MNNKYYNFLSSCTIKMELLPLEQLLRGVFVIAAAPTMVVGTSEKYLCTSVGWFYLLVTLFFAFVWLNLVLTSENSKNLGNQILQTFITLINWNPLSITYISINKIELQLEFMGKPLHYVNSPKSSPESEVTLSLSRATCSCCGWQQKILQAPQEWPSHYFGI